MKKIGVLLPHSKAYPNLSKDFMNGLKLGFKNNPDVEIKIEGIGFGENVSKIKDAIQKLVHQENIDIMTGMLGHNGLDEIFDLVNGLDETLIYSDIGATVPINLNRWSNILCNSFELHKSTYLLGKYLSSKNLRKIGISMCYNDAGYGFSKLLENSFINEENMELAGHFITPLTPNDNEAELMTSFIEASNPEALFCSYNGIFAKEHASFLKENKLTKKNIPIYMTPFCIEKEVLAEYPDIFDGVQSVSTWFPSLETKENNLFIQSYKEEYGKEPSVFSLLGYENSLLTQKHVKLKSIKFAKGPRGLLSFDKKTSRTMYDHYLWNVNFEKENYVLTKRLKLNDITKSQEDFFINKPAETGWINAYLCH